MMLSTRPGSRASSLASFSSVSSLSSHDSGAGGGKLRPSFMRRKSSRVLSLNHGLNHAMSCRTIQTMPAATGRPKKGRPRGGIDPWGVSRYSSASLVGSRGGAGRRRAGRREECTNRNEEWDPAGLARHLLRQKRRGRGILERRADPSPEKPPPKPTKKVTFGEESTIIDMDDASEEREWHDNAHAANSFHEASEKAERINRLMGYARHLESTYNGSTGLVAPRAIGEYLSCPEEVVGLELLLNGQSVARANLKANHRRSLAEEQRRQRETGGRADPAALARRLENSANISAHMARERAAFASQLE